MVGLSLMDPLRIMLEGVPIQVWVLGVVEREDILLQEVSLLVGLVDLGAEVEVELTMVRLAAREDKVDLEEGLEGVLIMVTPI